MSTEVTINESVGPTLVQDVTEFMHELKNLVRARTAGGAATKRA